MTSNDTFTPTSVHVHSLPWSLRHVEAEGILDDARALAVFLSETTTSQREGGVNPADTGLGNWRRGLELCFDLLVDKLDIASGVYRFPLASVEHDAPYLCERDMR